MRLIDADAIPKEFLEYEFDGKWNGCTIKDLIDEQPTIQQEKAQLSQEGTTSDLISRQAAIDALDCINGAEEVLRSLPPAQPDPQEGHWINGKCDLCGEHAPFWCMASTYHESNFCPNCGAKMTISTK